MKFENENERLKLYQTALQRYQDHITAVAEKYNDDIRLVCGVEVCTLDRGNTLLPANVDISMFDYCLIEHLDCEDTHIGDLFSFAKRCGCKHKGVAHTDIPRFLKKNKSDIFNFFHRMAQENIFWELNVNFDSIHGFHEHEYVKQFWGNAELIDIVRQSGVSLSVGFDGHRVEDYKPERVRDACRKLEDLNIPMVRI